MWVTKIFLLTVVALLGITCEKGYHEDNVMEQMSKDLQAHKDTSQGKHEKNLQFEITKLDQISQQLDQIKEYINSDPKRGKPGSVSKPNGNTPSEPIRNTPPLSSMDIVVEEKINTQSDSYQHPRGHIPEDVAGLSNDARIRGSGLRSADESDFQSKRADDTRNTMAEKMLKDMDNWERSEDFYESDSQGNHMDKEMMNGMNNLKREVDYDSNNEGNFDREIGKMEDSLVELDEELKTIKETLKKDPKKKPQLHYPGYALSADTKSKVNKLQNIMEDVKGIRQELQKSR